MVCFLASGKKSYGVTTLLMLIDLYWKYNVLRQFNFYPESLGRVYSYLDGLTVDLSRIISRL